MWVYNVYRMEISEALSGRKEGGHTWGLNNMLRIVHDTLAQLIDYKATCMHHGLLSDAEHGLIRHIQQGGGGAKSGLPKLGTSTLKTCAVIYAES